MTQEHKVPANLPAAASYTPSSVGERAASWAGDSKDFATLSGHLCWHRSAALSWSVCQRQNKHSCLPLLQISLTSVLGILARDKSLFQGAGSSVWEQLSCPPSLPPWHYKLNCDCFALLMLWITLRGPAGSHCLLCAGECCPRLLIKKVCVGRDFHLPSGTGWNFFIKLVVTAAKQLWETA